MTCFSCSYIAFSTSLSIVIVLHPVIFCLHVQDKEVRAAFLNLIALLVGDFHEYATVLRYLPQPAFYVDRVRYTLDAYHTCMVAVHMQDINNMHKMFTSFRVTHVILSALCLNMECNCVQL